MSSSKQLVINCGASRVTASVIEVQSGVLNLERWVTVPLDYDFTDDEAWLGAVRAALRELSHGHHLSGKATVIIPGNQVLTKTIRIPHVEEAKRAQILAFEAQQNIPYPLHEVVWDSQVVGDDGVETEVLFIACKSNTINEICSIVSAAGFTPERINAATILEYNALQLASDELEEDVLLINIGARSTNLIFKSANGFFARNIQLGGNTLTQNIADSLGKSFAEAEDIKQKFFSGGLDYADDDSGAKLLQGSADAFVRRTSQEITRSIVNYRRQKNAASPKRILLTGRGALLRGLSDQLSSSQKTKVDFFDPLQGVVLGEKITTDPEELRLEAGEIIGEAARGLVPDSAGVNLLPGDLQAEIAFRSKKPLLLVAAVCIALAPWPAMVGYQKLSAEYSVQAKALQAQTAPLQTRLAAITTTEERARAIGEQIEQVKGLVNSKSNWIQFFAELQESLMQAEDVWLDDLSVEREQAKAEETGDAANAEEAGMEKAPTYEIVLKGQMLVRESAQGGGIN
ncbi:MAG TPA: pilus assembly protein PilM, partial [Opitutales bacterium]|nr:pilus assembly protein PilM [Opitutales bacterium]